MSNVSTLEHRKASGKYTRRSAKSWQALGVPVTTVPGDYPTDDRETSTSFVGQEDAEVTTARYSWQKRLEELGIKPDYITRFKNSWGEIRVYTVPQRFIKLPSDGRKKCESV